ncbi:unnamed protein product [Didymodactylos carnosus]|uniref:Uncharacterized protein n=1 Tax=Didymodactylos carnosus TaxID=1234261 RepID=A0A813ZSF2_9BILA|nr:unnamed protein product [Didymodactylos carnosus]CAF1351717.1 unnamed protein product [Didymodactylos carnosus]CAF3686444.1 unnamed protein product [Didymodactylos carnosus]CAF4162228.1 unnamed protein product [Didymodactylos carnosus]
MDILKYDDTDHTVRSKLDQPYLSSNSHERQTISSLYEKCSACDNRTKSTHLSFPESNNTQSAQNETYFPFDKYLNIFSPPPPLDFTLEKSLNNSKLYDILKEYDDAKCLIDEKYASISRQNDDSLFLLNTGNNQSNIHLITQDVEQVTQHLKTKKDINKQSRSETQIAFNRHLTKKTSKSQTNHKMTHRKETSRYHDKLDGKPSEQQIHSKHPPTKILPANILVTRRNQSRLIINPNERLLPEYCSCNSRLLGPPQIHDTRVTESSYVPSPNSQSQKLTPHILPSIEIPSISSPTKKFRFGIKLDSVYHKGSDDNDIVSNSYKQDETSSNNTMQLLHQNLVDALTRQVLEEISTQNQSIQYTVNDLQTPQPTPPFSPIQRRARKINTPDEDKSFESTVSSTEIKQEDQYSIIPERNVQTPIITPPQSPPATPPPSPPVTIQKVPLTLPVNIPVEKRDASTMATWIELPAKPPVIIQTTLPPPLPETIPTPSTPVSTSQSTTTETLTSSTSISTPYSLHDDSSFSDHIWFNQHSEGELHIDLPQTEVVLSKVKQRLEQHKQNYNNNIAITDGDSESNSAGEI